MQNKGFEVTGTQCDSKWKALKKQFEKVHLNKTTSGAKRMDWEYYNASPRLFTFTHI